MIPKGLKVGENYLEGNLVYKVVRVIGDGRYEGTWTGEIRSESSSVEQPKKEVKEEVKEEKVDLYSLQYAQLKKMCAEKGLDAKGTKSELIARLEG